MLNYDNQVTLGAKLLLMEGRDNPDFRFVDLLFSNRTSIGQLIANSYPDFSETYRLMLNADEQIRAGATPSLQPEFDSMFDLLGKGSSCSADINFRVLLAAVGAFMSRGDDQETRNMLAQLVENDPQSVTGIQQLVLVSVMLWFTDYRGYKQAIQVKLNDEPFVTQFTYQSQYVKVGENYWIVVKALEQGKKLLLLSDEILGFESFNGQDEGLSYAQSPLRQLMNNEANPDSYISRFLLGDADVARRIMPTQLSDCVGAGGPITDKLFPLSASEAQELDFQVKQACWYNLPEKKYWYLSSIDFSPFDWWWLRTPAADGDPSYVKNDGQLVTDVGCASYNTYGVRPAFWADNSDGFFDGRFISTDQHDNDIQAKRSAEGQRANEYQAVLDRLGNVQIGLNTKMKDLPDLLSSQQQAQSQANSTAPGSSGKSGGGCYVATAVYGSYDCPEVWTLRRYRDSKLASTRRGRMFIRIYYSTSPTLVRLFGEAAWFKSFVKPRLDSLVEKLHEEGYQSTPYDDKPW